MMPFVKKCCFCISLRTGGQILGVISSVVSTVWICLVTWMFFFINSRIDEAIDMQDSINDVNLNDSTESTTPTNDDGLSQHRLILTLVISVLLIANISVLVSAVLLFIGARTKRKELIIPYLVTDAFSILFEMGCFLIKDIALIMSHTEENIIIAVYVIYFILSIYLWICIFSLYQWIKQINRYQCTDFEAVYTTRPRN
ncbi:uncharacterized protein LOC129791692 [Lutzomyia longipalpis]|uniref:uncharacterized protein LOC129791692 n=1 Tax=Lutzomyia longipalpis TaxID=7200 RepID=UPI002483D5AA|nr:uncharacterized protein LOC129791692 [Lutzomyia longipalpis]